MEATYLEIPQDVLDAARLSAGELKTELALSLYAQGRLTIGKACEFAGMSLWEFRHLATVRRIPAHYEAEDLREDIAVTRGLDRR